MVYLAPTCKEEYLAMLEYSYNQNEHPVAIRVPSVALKSTGVKDETDYSVLNKFKVAEKGEKVAIIGLGDFFELGKKVKSELKNKLGIDATLDGGFGEKITRFYGNSDMKVLNYGSIKEFSDRTPMDELLTRYRLKPELIADDIKNIL